MCTKFDNIGFLSSELDEIEGRIRQLYPVYIDWIYKTNQFCQELQYEFTVTTNNSDELVAATLYARIVATYQSFILIVRKGMLHQTEMLLRCIVECVFQLVAISKNKDYSNKIIGSEQYQCKHTYKNLIRFHNRHNPQHKDLDRFRGELKQIEENILKHQLKKLSVYQTAEDAGLGDWYDVVYGDLSNTIHASIRSLEETLVVNHNKIEAVKSEPEINNLGHLFLIALQAMNYSIHAISSVLHVNSSVFSEELEEAIKVLGKKEKNSRY